MNSKEVKMRYEYLRETTKLLNMYSARLLEPQGRVSRLQ